MNVGVTPLLKRIDEFIVDGALRESILDVLSSNELEKTSRNVFNVLIDKFFTPLDINVSDFEDFIQTLKPEVTSASILLRKDSSILEGIIEDFNEFEQYYNEFKEYTQEIENHKYAILIPNFNDKFGIQSISSNQGFKDLLEIDKWLLHNLYELDEMYENTFKSTYNFHSFFNKLFILII